MVFLKAAYCQSTEVNLNINSGLFSFSGESVEGFSSINYDLRDEDGYTNNPYGSGSGLSAGLSASLTHIAKSHFLIGIGLGYELLRSKIVIDRISAYDGMTNESIAANGQTYLNSNFINLFPTFGYRLALSKVNIDLSGGLDLAYCLGANEKGYAQADTRAYETRRDRTTIRTDLRPRIQANASRGKYGAYVGYSKGIRNYKSGFDGGVNEAYGDMLRFGLSYRLH